MSGSITLKTLFPTDPVNVLSAYADMKNRKGEPVEKLSAKILKAECRVGKDISQQLMHGGEISAGKIKQVAAMLGVESHLLVAEEMRATFKQKFCKRSVLHAPDDLEAAKQCPPISRLPEPCRNSHFVRQDDIDAIKEMMKIEGDPEKTSDLQVLASLSGFPGIGKSELAVRLACDEDVVRTFEDGVLWFECPPQRHSRIQDQLNCEVLLSDINQEITGEALGHLPLLQQIQAALGKTLSNNSVLLILDDAWDQRITSALTSVVPHHCSVIVTTSKPASFDERTDERIRVYDVPELSEEDVETLIAAVFALADQEMPGKKTTSELVSVSGRLPATAIMTARTFLCFCRRGTPEKEALRLIQHSLRNSILPRRMLGPNVQSLNVVLSSALSALSAVSLQHFKRLPTLGIFSPTVNGTDLESIWGKAWATVAGEMVDVGLMRAVSQGGKQRFGINRFVYAVAEELRSE